MRASLARSGTRVRVPWGAATVGKSHGQGDGYVDGVVLAALPAEVTVRVSVPGERAPRTVVLRPDASGEIDLVRA